MIVRYYIPDSDFIFTALCKFLKCSHLSDCQFYRCIYTPVGVCMHNDRTDIFLIFWIFLDIHVFAFRHQNKG